MKDEERNRCPNPLPSNRFMVIKILFLKKKEDFLCFLFNGKLRKKSVYKVAELHFESPQLVIFSYISLI